MGVVWLWGRKINPFSEGSTYRTVEDSFFRTTYIFHSPLRYGFKEL